MAYQYLAFTIYGKTVAVHRYIWECINGPVPEGYHIHHKNGDKKDNRIENLEMLPTRTHMQLTQKELTPEQRKANRAAIKKAVAKPIRCVETGVVYESVMDAAKAMGANNTSHLNAVLRGKYKTYHGFHWEYAG